MPDGASVSALSPPAASQPKRFRPRWVSPLLRRILLVNALPLVLLVAALLYLDQYQNGLLEAQVTALREQARVFAGALGESAVSVADPDNPNQVAKLIRELAGDPARIARMREAALAAAPAYDRVKELEKFVEIVSRPCPR